MQAISVEKVCYIVLKAREFDVKVAPVEPDPGSNPADEMMDTVLEDYPDDPVFQELKSVIGDLNVDEQIELVALAWVGRGTYAVDEWQEAVREARRGRNERTAGYLLGMPELGDFLEEGLAQLGYSCAEFERSHL